MTASPPAEHTRVVVADRFPVFVTSPIGAQYSGARVIITRPDGDTPGWVWIWADRRPDPELILNVPWTPDTTVLANLAPTVPWRITAPDGEWTVERGFGCGCGSPLKRLLPWQPMRRGRL